jgi:hypothetical protein
MKSIHSGTSSFKPGRHLQMFNDIVDDPYQLRGKLAEPTVCITCNAVYHQGRWQWSTRPKDAVYATCTACQRIHDNMPAGYVTIEGEFVSQHGDEILSLIKHHEANEKSEHPLQRIMSIERRVDKIIITTTDIHLARGIGEALHHAYKGELGFHYNRGEYLLLVHWQR